MNKLNFSRKSLYMVLGITIVCLFTLTIVYAALSTVLTIQGSAQITASNWDIHLENPILKNGSATANVPVIKTSSLLEFSTTLNTPGDFYEFTVDVVNNGSIDAMIDSVVKTPELTTEQTKYLKYEVSYANGESITAKQNIAAGATMPIKVRVEYRTDLTASDLPTVQTVLDLSLTLVYIQSDGTGSNVTNNGQDLIDFTIDGVTYHAQKDMTWTQWISSSYAPPGAYINDESGKQPAMEKENKNYYIKTSDGQSLNIDDIIIEGEAYILLGGAAPE